MVSEPRHEKVDAVVVGGGFYGCVIALELKRVMGLANVTLVERAPRLLERSSYVNQARIHNGYHYPRSFTTAFRSRVNFPRFVERYRGCVDDQFTMLYAVALRNSQVTARQFERFCREIDAPCVTAEPKVARLFSSATVERVFQVVEFAFDARKLADSLRDELDGAGVVVRTNSEVLEVRRSPSAVVAGIRAGGDVYHLEAAALFNCTYARLQHLASRFDRLLARLKFEIAEIGLVEVPDELKRYGVTVMDGPFFSTMPFPGVALHTLSHARYTPHVSWTSVDFPNADPYEILAQYERPSRVGLMQRDAARFLPLLKEARYRDSLFEVKVVLMANEVDDARPILVERHDARTYSILGGKLDNVFDVLAALPRLQGVSSND